MVIAYSEFSSRDCVPNKHKFDNQPWNDTKHKKYNNCYSYAINDPDPSRTKKRWPGENEKNETKYSCEYIEKLLKIDHPDMIKTDDFKKCPCDSEYNVIALMTDDKGIKRDFHFYRLDENNLWSHKLGSREVSNKDGNNKLIRDPKISNNSYLPFDYDFCSYYCLKK